MQKATPIAELARVARFKAACLAPVDGVERDLHSEVDRLAAQLKDVMQEIHGGQWRIQVEHEAKFVMVVFRCR